MKKYNNMILGFVLFVLAACNTKTRNEEEEIYNPYDTSEMEQYNSSDTIYTTDSVIKTFKLRELK